MNWLYALPNIWKTIKSKFNNQSKSCSFEQLNLKGSMMKSAWELALERSGGNLNELSDDKKSQIADIDNSYKAKMAEIEITYQQKFTTVTAVEELEQLKDNMAVEQASARSLAENRKKEVRNS
jgi:hypothetical protein